METVQHIIDGGFARVEPTRRLEAIQLLAQLYEIAAAGQVSLEHMAVETLFDRSPTKDPIWGGSFFIPKEKKAAIAEALKEIRAQRVKRPPFKSIKDETIKNIKTMCDGAREEFQSLNQRNANQIESQCRDTLRELNERLENLVRARAALDKLDEQELDITGELKALLDEGWFTYHGYSKPNKEITFFTPEVWISEVNSAAKLDVRVCLGRFKVGVYIPTLSITVYPYQNNVEYRGYLTPFVISGDSNGICWGNMTLQAMEYRLTRKFLPLMNLLRALLTTYSTEGKPFALIHAFHRERERKREALRIACESAKVAAKIEKENLKAQAKVEARAPQEGVPLFDGPQLEAQRINLDVNRVWQVQEPAPAAPDALTPEALQRARAALLDQGRYAINWNEAAQVAEVIFDEPFEEADPNR